MKKTKLTAAEVVAYWQKNADLWIKVSERGDDIWRDHFNTPAFIDALPSIKSKKGLEVGFGDGYNTLKIAEICAQLISVDICDKFLKHNQARPNNPKNIKFFKANAEKLAFASNSFDFAVGLMIFMDMANLKKVLKEIFRVLKPGGFLQFSIIHPCFPESKGLWLENEKKERAAFAMRDYFKETHGDIHEWHHYCSSANENFEVPRFEKPLHKWVNLLVQVGFKIEAFIEPVASESAIARFPILASTRIVAHSLIIRVRK